MHIKQKITHFFSRKRNIWLTVVAAVVLLIIGILVAGRGKGPAGIQIGAVTRQDLQETVLVTGQVVSGTDLDLSFQSSGIVRAILIKEGDKAVRGQTLAYLDAAGARASLTSAKGSYAQAQANYDKLMAGATQENVQTYEDTVIDAEQDVLNEYNSASVTLNTAYTNVFNAHSVISNIHNTYFSSKDQQGIAVYDAWQNAGLKLQDAKAAVDAASIGTQAHIDAAISKMILALNAIYNDLAIVRTQTDQGQYYLQVSSTDKASLDSQKTSINTSVSAVVSVQHDLASLKIALQKAKDQLKYITAPPTQAEIDLAKAQLLSAQGQVDAAQATVNNTVIVAPAAGVITSIDIKAGELATALKEVIKLQDVGDLHAEADVSEANIASLQLGQTIDYTFDALGPDKHFAGKVLTINPASTVISGVVNYKVKGSLENVPQVKPGMTANLTILVAEQQQVLAVPSTAIVNRGNKYYVRVIDDPKKLTYHEVEVQTGLQADGGLVEIVSGLAEGEAIVTYSR